MRAGCVCAIADAPGGVGGEAIYMTARDPYARRCPCVFPRRAVLDLDSSEMLYMLLLLYGV